MTATQTARLAAILVDIAEINDVWSDSDEQERAFFVAHLADLHAEANAIRVKAETTKARRNWRASAKRAADAISALAVTSDRNYRSANDEALRIIRNLDRAQSRGYEYGIAKEMDQRYLELRGAALPAAEKAARWYSERLAFKIDRAAAEERRANQRQLSPAEAQYHAELSAMLR